MKVLYTSSDCQAHAEAYAALGYNTYVADKRMRRVYVAWLLRRRREEEAVRAERRKAREYRWRLIEAGELAPLGITETDFRRGDPLSEATLGEEFREDAAARRRSFESPAPSDPVVDEAPEPSVSIAEAAEMLGLRTATLRQRAARGAIRSFKVKGRGVQIPVAETERPRAVREEVSST